ncbi:MAG: hypothetical protein K2X87_28070 [Gemmataceae bacterium]|nr:hypothetical protein [Gemmataceae bacterium]
MPLLDHFHPPLLDDPPWPSLYTLWVGGVVRRLNRTLPGGQFRAFANVRLGPHVEADVAEYRRPPANGTNGPAGGGGVATQPRPRVAPVARFPLALPDDIEVQVAEGRHSMTLAGVIEFVSPANKKEEGERAAFVRKCAAYLHRGIGLVVVDVVTSRLANLHNELMAAVGGPPAAVLTGTPTYVVGYGPVHSTGGNELEVWPFPVAVGRPLPTAPLALRRGPVIDLDLEGTYTEAVADSGL